MSAKQRLAIISAVLFVLGGGVGSVYLLALFVGRYNPALGSRPVGALETILGIPLLLGWMLVGLVTGISRLFAWLFDRLYPA